MSQKKIKVAEKRSENLDPNQDGFIEKTTSVFDWVYDHRRPIGLVIVLALLVAIGGIVVDRILQSRASDDSKLVGEGLEAATAMVEPADPTQTPEPDKKESDVLTFDSNKARATEALKRWKKVSDKSGTSLQAIGDMGIATSHLELGENDKAVAEYEKLLSEKNDTLGLLRPALIEALGYAMEAAGKIDEARSRFEKLMAESQGEAKKMATYQAGRMAQLKGDAPAAKKLFKEVLDTYTDDAKPSRLDMLFVQARTRLLALDPSAKVPDLPAGGMGAFEGMDPQILQQLLQARGGAGAS